MILYHGSGVIIEKPLYGYGKPHNDYGQGFYCTQDMELAKEWACQDTDGGFVNTYELDDSGLKVLDLSVCNPVSWIALLLSNRIVRYSSPLEKKAAAYLKEHFLPDTTGYDLLTGYRADDSYFTYARAFLANTISAQQLQSALRLGNLGIQVCLKSRESFNAIRFMEAVPVDGETYYPKYIQRDDQAREAYYRLLEQDPADGLYVRDIIRKEMCADDLCL
ncbi:MAG: DUF3990 domain-containing protein [Lachnospiraceae bacterium]|nr:DUF3990 domain-containing protein [Lachnospiraceae bacterium]